MSELPKTLEADFQELGVDVDNRIKAGIRSADESFDALRIAKETCLATNDQIHAIENAQQCLIGAKVLLENMKGFKRILTGSRLDARYKP